MRTLSIFLLLVLLLILAGCGIPEAIQSPFGTLISQGASEAVEQGGSQFGTLVAKAKAEAADQAGSGFGTLVAQAKTEVAQQMATQRAKIGTQIAGALPGPWDTGWLPSDEEHSTAKINGIITGTGLENLGQDILADSLAYGVNPGFALAMFRKEAEFARPGTRAHTNKNPGNIIATGDCRGQPAGTACTGVYGETGTDGRFGVYPDMLTGLRAYFWLLQREYGPGTSRNCTDMPCVIRVYCPPSDCDTDRYVRQISTWTGQYMLEILAP